MRHLTKTGRGQRALCRGTGAMAVIGASRTAFLVGQHPDDPGRRLFACTKNNLLAPPPSLAYRIRQDPAGAAVVDWDGAQSLTADDVVLAPTRPAGDAVADAVAFLRDLLTTGPVRCETVHRQACALGLSKRTLRRAKTHLGIRSHQAHEAGRSVWYWSLNPDA